MIKKISDSLQMIITLFGLGIVMNKKMNISNECSLKKYKKKCNICLLLE